MSRYETARGMAKRSEDKKTQDVKAGCSDEARTCVCRECVHALYV